MKYWNKFEICIKVSDIQKIYDITKKEVINNFQVESGNQFLHPISIMICDLWCDMVIVYGNFNKDNETYSIRFNGSEEMLYDNGEMHRDSSNKGIHHAIYDIVKLLELDKEVSYDEFYDSVIRIKIMYNNNVKENKRHKVYGILPQDIMTKISKLEKDESLLNQTIANAL